MDSNDSRLPRDISRRYSITTRKKMAMFQRHRPLHRMFASTAKRGSSLRSVGKRKARIERLEKRNLLAGDVIGVVFDDTNNNGIQDNGEELVADINVYIDVNRNGRLDVGEPSDVTASVLNADGGNYRIINGLAANTSVAVRVDVDIARVSAPGLTSSWTATESELSDVNLDTKVRDLVSGDFDGDGNTDIAVLQQLRNSGALASVAIFLAADDGSFPKQASKTIPIGNSQNTPTEFVAADLNANGKTDLIIVDSGTGEIVLLGDFDGADFSERQSISVSGPVDVVVENFDSDPALEIVVLSKSSASQVTLYQPISPFGYSGQTPKPTGRENPGRFVVGDFNNDQTLDLAVFHAASAASPNDSREIAVLLGAADGTFGDPIVSTIGQRAFESALVAGRFAGDDDNHDLAVISGSSVIILAGDGAGKFTEVSNIDDSQDPGEPSLLSAADLDGDGDSDLAFTSIRTNFGNSFAADARVFENVNGSFVQRYRAFQVNVTFSTKRVAPVLLSNFRVDQSNTDAMRLVIAAPSQSIDDEFFGLKHSSLITKEYAVFLRSTATTGRDFGVNLVDNAVLDVTGSGTPNPFRDGILILRYMFELGTEDLEGLSPDGAPRTGGAEIKAYLDQFRTALDVNGDGDINPFQDGILILRYLFQLGEDDLEGLSPAGSTRTTGVEIERYLDTLMPQRAEGELFAFQASGSAGEGEYTSFERTLLNPLDVNGDGTVTARDALNVINEVSRGSHATSHDGQWSRFDTNQDGRVTTADSLLVINHLTDDVTGAPVAVAAADGEDDDLEAVDQVLTNDEFFNGLF